MMQLKSGKGREILGLLAFLVVSTVFLGEAPTAIHLIGGALSLGGMWLGLRRDTEASSGQSEQAAR